MGFASGDLLITAERQFSRNPVQLRNRQFGRDRPRCATDSFLPARRRVLRTQPRIETEPGGKALYAQN